MKKLLSLLLTLSLVLTLAAPALAARKTADPDQPTWQVWEYESLEAMLEDMNIDELTYYLYYATPAEQTAWIDAYTAAHPEEAEAFDADAYYAQIYGSDMSKAEYMEIYGMETQEEFTRDMTLTWINNEMWRAEQQALVDEYTAAHPDEVAAFDADAYYEANYLDFYGEKSVYMEMGGLTEDEFANDMLAGYIYDQQALQAAKDAWAETVAAEPELTAQFLADVDRWIAEDHWYGYGSLAEYVEESGYTEEEAYLNFYDSWKFDYEYAQERKAAQDARITELGGALGQVNVLVNDKMIPFGSAKPVLDGDGTLLAPADSLSKALGILVKGDANGYAPVRFTAENAGWDVMWDDDYQTAVLINRNGVIGNIDAKFTQLDALYVELLDVLKREEGQSYKIDETLSLNLTAFDSLDGDKTYTAGVKGTSTVKDGVISASLTLDLAGLVRQLSPELKDAITANLPKKISASALTQLLTGIKVDVILNPEDGLYLRAPILAEFSEDVDAESWLYFETPYYLSVEAGAAEAAPVSLNIGTLIYASNIYRYGYYYDEVDAYFDIMDAADTLAAFLGNDRFTTSGNDISYKLDTKTVNGLIAKSTEDSYSGPMEHFFKTADVSATLSGGKLSFKAEVRPDTEAAAIQSGYGGPETVLMAWLSSLVDFRFQTNGSVAAGGSNYTMEFHWKNQFDAKLSYTSSVQKTNTAPIVAPPDDADVVDAYELFYSFSPYVPYSMYGMMP